MTPDAVADTIEVIIHGCLGTWMLLVGYGRATVSRDPVRNAAWVSKYGTLAKIGGCAWIVLAAVQLAGR